MKILVLLVVFLLALVSEQYETEWTAKDPAMPAPLIPGPGARGSGAHKQSKRETAQGLNELQGYLSGGVREAVEFLSKDELEILVHSKLEVGGACLE